jgi:hypothetical protein
MTAAQQNIIILYLFVFKLQGGKPSTPTLASFYSIFNIALVPILSIILPAIEKHHIGLPDGKDSI